MMAPRFHTLLMTSTALLVLGATPCAADPMGGSVVGGSATIQGSGTGNVTVNQSSQRAIINWSTFNIGAGETTTFVQPNSSSVVLNRVTGGLGPSTINGTLSGNGHVYLVNRDGVLVGPGGVINTAGFLATTSDISNQDFMAGRNNFGIPGRPDASIVNQGRITATTGGFAALVAPGVRNSGTITATLGTVTLASGNTFTLDLYGDKLIQLAPGDAIAGKVIDVATGKPLSALVRNEGTVKANGGRVELSAVAARQVVDAVINNTGVIEANSVGTRNGKIVLGAATGASKPAGAPKQTVKISGAISAAGKAKGTKGGTVVATGESIEVRGAKINVSGRAGGGKVMLGGDWAGGHPALGIVDNQSATLEAYQIANATTLTVDATTTINASATRNGNGGKVVLWSDSQTTFAGTILARGGDAGGNGGFVEVSSNGWLGFGGNVDSRAPRGTAGTLLLDPYDVTISDSPTYNGGFGQDGTWTPGDYGSTINVTDLVSQLGNGNVVVTTSGRPSSEDRGNITVAAPITWTSGSTLTLVADNNIAINAAITATKGGLTLSAENAITASGAVNIGRFTLASGDWSQVTPDLPAFSARDFRITGGSFLRAKGGNGDNEPYRIADVYGLQGIGSSYGPLGSNYVLANDIDASGTTGWNDGQGFVPIGSFAQFGFVGSLDGKNFTISGLTIAPTDRSKTDIGLFSTIFGSVSNLNLTNVSVTANPNAYQTQFVGALAGSNGGTITNVHASGTVNGTVFNNGVPVTGIIAGGLVGQNGVFGEGSTPGTISSSSADVAVSVGNARSCVEGYCVDFNIAGGLVGSNAAFAAEGAPYGSTIINSQAFGTVTGGTFSVVGGLVGQNGSGGTTGKISGTSQPIQTSECAAGASFTCATGAVSVGLQGSAGGLVGQNSGFIVNAFATGNVRTGNDGIAGGLVGNNIPNESYCGRDCVPPPGYSNDGKITDSWASGAVSGTLNSVIGGLVGWNYGSITNAYHTTGAVSGTGALAVGGFVGMNMFDATITSTTPAGTYATAPVSNTGFGVVGGFAGVNWGSITLSYATGSVTNLTSDAGAYLGGFVGLNTGTINQAYATGAVNGGSGSFLGGFVGANFGLPGEAAASMPGSITQSYALGPVTGSNTVVAAAFAALNLGTLDQTYGVGRVTGGTGSTLGGLVAISSYGFTPPSGDGVPPTDGATAYTGVTTNSYWDRQTTAQNTSAGGTALDTAVLAGALPVGFSTNVWAHSSYPQLVNLGAQNTEPGPPVLPPIDQPDQPDQQSQPPSDSQQQIIGQLNKDGLLTPPTIAEIVNAQGLFNQQINQQTNQQNQQNQQNRQNILPGAGPGTPPGYIDAGPGRYFFIPPPGETRFVANQVILYIDSSVPLDQLQRIAGQVGLTVIGSQEIGLIGQTAYQFEITGGGSVADKVRELVAFQEISGATPVFVYTLTQDAASARSDTRLEGDAAQYVLQKLQLNAVHRAIRGSNVSIAVIDSEIDGRHPDLSGAVVNQYDATGVADEKPHMHGTGMAGAIASHRRLVGAAPGARLLAIRAFTTKASTAESTTFSILKGLDYAVTNGVRIVNMSFAGPRDPSLERAIKAAADRGVIMIAAAGNAGPKSPPLWPAADPNVIAVTATDVDDKLFAGANRGRYIAIAAPGVDILVPAPDSAYQMTTGTSVATAHISGIVALMLERNPRLTPVDVRRILTQSAKRLGANDQFGAGLVDPVKALQLAAPRSSELTPPPRR